MAETSFEQELRNITKHANELMDVAILGDTCYGRLIDSKFVIRLEFITTWASNEYDTLKITVINKLCGVMDVLELNIYRTLHLDSRTEHMVYMSRTHGKVYWDTSILNDDDYKQFAKYIDKYLKLFSDGKTVS